MIMMMNGALFHKDDANVSVFDHGFMYGIGLFETFRTYEGKPFLLEQHMERLEAGCNILGIAWKRDDKQIELDIQQLLVHNGWNDAYIRYTVTAGPDQLGLPVNNYDKPNVLIYVKPLPQTPPSLYEKGKPLQKLRTVRNTPETPVRLKSLHFMNNIIAKRELSQYPWAVSAEGLLLTAQGFLSEGTVSNLFFVKAGVLYTPAVETGILPGITRKMVLQLCRSLQVQTHEGWYTWDDLLQADEIFLTNSIQEIVPVTCLFGAEGESYKISNGKAGTYTVRIMNEYRKLIREVSR